MTKSITSPENQTSQRRLAPMVIAQGEIVDRFRVKTVIGFMKIRSVTAKPQAAMPLVRICAGRSAMAAPTATRGLPEPESAQSTFSFQRRVTFRRVRDMKVADQAARSSQ